MIVVEILSLDLIVIGFLFVCCCFVFCIVGCVVGFFVIGCVSLVLGRGWVVVL